MESLYIRGGPMATGRRRTAGNAGWLVVRPDGRGVWTRRPGRTMMSLMKLS